MVAPQLRPIQEEDWLLPDTEADVWLDDKRKLMIDQVTFPFGAVLFEIGQ